MLGFQGVPLKGTGCYVRRFMVAQPDLEIMVFSKSSAENLELRELN